MAFGDAAKAALSRAIEALQAIAEVKAIVQQVQISIASHEQRVESRVSSLEVRIRELERENARLNGLVNGAYADALKTVFLDLQHRERVPDIPKVQVDKTLLADRLGQRDAPDKPED